MKLTNFERVRLGSTWPSCVDVIKLGLHEENGVYAETWLHCGIVNGESSFSQLRRHNAEKKVALFCFSWSDAEYELLPDSWKNSSVLWDSRYHLK